MPIVAPALDDRGFNDLVDEAIARIPAHTPEWSYPTQGDPGRTLIELFAWLTDTLLYRANLIPERQRLAFLRLLGVGMRPAAPASSLVGLSIDSDKIIDAAYLQPLATLAGPATFETTTEVTVLPVSMEAYYKRRLGSDEAAQMRTVIDGLQQLYHLSGAPSPYETTPVFANGAPDKTGFDVIGNTVDGYLWLALLAPKGELVEKVRDTLGKEPNGGRQLISIGVTPAIPMPDWSEDVGPSARKPCLWEISSVDANGNAVYLTLDVIADTTAGLTKQGVIRLALPAPEDMAAPSNDVRAMPRAGVGNLPPRLDVADKASRLITWLRLRPQVTLHSLSLSWVGINAVEIDGRQTVVNRVVGQSDGGADQVFQLPGGSIDPGTLQLQVEEAGLGYQPWQQIDDLALAGRDDAVFSLDSEAGTVRFGNGVRGRIPDTGRRIRVAMMRAGGGSAGNLPVGALTKISARDLNGNPLTVPLKVQQPLPLDGGVDAETLPEAEQRIPGLFRHADRAVTADDYRRLVAGMPGIHAGRVEVLPRFKPQQRRGDVPGVVSVVALPFQTDMSPPNPRPDRPFLEAVYGYLDARRPVSAELYVIGCEYVPLGVSVGVNLRDGFGENEVLNAVRAALRAFLWPLAPGGLNGAGWDLGRAVRARELEVVVARVPGVDTVSPVNVFDLYLGQWRLLNGEGTLSLNAWQLPELLSVVAVAGDASPPELQAPDSSDGAVPIPVVPKVC